MKIRPLSISGAWEITPQQHGDARGVFLEWYRHDRLKEVTGHSLRLAQANLSVSAAGVVRGVHFADAPPGQAKYITCPVGAAWDVAVDLRVGSPTFGSWEAVLLDSVDRRATYLEEGLGHAFCALADDTVVTYLCSETYNPTAEHGINPLDPTLNITWPIAEPQLSPKDEHAVSLAEALATDLLPRLPQPAAAVEQRLIDQLVDRAQAEGLQLTGEGGLPQQLTKRLLESALEGET